MQQTKTSVEFELESLNESDFLLSKHPLSSHKRDSLVVSCFSSTELHQNWKSIMGSGERQ